MICQCANIKKSGAAKVANKKQGHNELSYRMYFYFSHFILPRHSCRGRDHQQKASGFSRTGFVWAKAHDLLHSLPRINAGNGINAETISMYTRAIKKQDQSSYQAIQAKI